jgi:putative membrane protein
MDLAQIIPLADSWGMHDGDIGAGWLIVMVPMMLLMMGGMMWMMMRGMGGGSAPGASAPGERPATESPATTESPLEILERRFAEGEISIEEYRARREALLNGTAEENGDRDEELLTAPQAGERRRS